MQNRDIKFVFVLLKMMSDKCFCVHVVSAQDAHKLLQPNGVPGLVNISS